MIEKIETINSFNSYKSKDLYSVRIRSLLSAYGCKYDFASFYRQINNNEITAIIAKLDSDFTLSFNDRADLYELEDFFSLLGFNSLLCESSFNPNFDYDEGIVMASVKKAEIHIPYTEIDMYPKLMDLFNLTDYDKTDFESWYVDISHRIRHGCAKAFTLTVNSEIVSSGIFSSIYNDDAILSAVKTAPEFRRMGYGSALVSEMMNDVRGKVYLMREYDKNEEFYKKLGFANTGKWRMYK